MALEDEHSQTHALTHPGYGGSCGKGGESGDDVVWVAENGRESGWREWGERVGRGVRGQTAS